MAPIKNRSSFVCCWLLLLSVWAGPPPPKWSAQATTTINAAQTTLNRTQLGFKSTLHISCVEISPRLFVDYFSVILSNGSSSGRRDGRSASPLPLLLIISTAGWKIRNVNLEPKRLRFDWLAPMLQTDKGQQQFEIGAVRNKWTLGAWFKRGRPALPLLMSRRWPQFSKNKKMTRFIYLFAFSLERLENLSNY